MSAVVEWQVRRPGAVAQPVVAFQSWLPIGGERHPPPVATKSQPSGGPQPKPTCRTLTDSPPPHLWQLSAAATVVASAAEEGRPRWRSIDGLCRHTSRSIVIHTLDLAWLGLVWWAFVQFDLTSSSLSFVTHTVLNHQLVGIDLL